MTSGFNYIQMHIGDFMGGCIHMDATEVGAYTMLLFAHYQSGEKGLPDDNKKLARIAKVSPKTWARIKDTVLDKFYLDGSFWKNSRAVNEFQKRSNISANQKTKALKRWKTPMPLAMPEACITNNQEPITNNQYKPPTPLRGKYPRPDDVSEKVWKDFTKLRNVKKAAITGTALDGIRSEAVKAGIAFEDALREMCARGWQGFKAEWFLNTKGKGKNGLSKHERAQTALRESAIELGYAD